MNATRVAPPTWGHKFDKLNSMLLDGWLGRERDSSSLNWFSHYSKYWIIKYLLYLACLVPTILKAGSKISCSMIRMSSNGSWSQQIDSFKRRTDDQLYLFWIISYKLLIDVLSVDGQCLSQPTCWQATSTRFDWQI